MDNFDAKAALERIEQLDNSPYRMIFKSVIERDNFAMFLRELGMGREAFGISDCSIIFLNSESYSTALLLR